MTRSTQSILDDIIRWNYKGKSTVRKQLELWISHPKVKKTEINDYFCMEFHDFFVVRKDCSVYKSFETMEEATDYCLDKVNNESKQSNLF